MAFHLGSLGFLTPFKFDNFQQQVTNVLEGHAALTLRSRLRCIIVRKNEDKEKPPPNLLVLNEVVIDRGPSPYLSNIDLFLDGKHITSVQGDGNTLFLINYKPLFVLCILENTVYTFLINIIFYKKKCVTKHIKMTITL